MKTKYILCITAMIAFYACKKSDSVTPATENSGEKIQVGLNLGGITTTDSPMGNSRKYVAARNSFDSTFYAIDVRESNGSPYAQGLYNTPQNIMLELEKNHTYLLRVAAIKKGTGNGMPVAFTSDGPYLYRPFFKPVKNEMIYNTAVPNSPDELNPTFLDSLDYMSVLEDPFTGTSSNYFYPELEIHYQTLYFNTGDAAMTLNMFLNRICFGITYNLINFQDGTLQVDYNGYMKSRTFSAYSSNNLSIYTVDQFRYMDSINSPIDLTFTFVKYDGTTVPMGSRQIYPKRNKLTTINVTQPTGGGKAVVNTNIVLVDTAFAGNTTVQF